MKAIILAAGLGSRLGQANPKPLTRLENGRSIMQHQVDALTRYISIDDIAVVVGFKKEMIMEAFPQLTYVYNERFDTTNTAKSLLCALRKMSGHDVLWLNGDVVFDHRVMDKMRDQHETCMAVNTASVAEEEVKYLVDDDGYIIKVSKEVIGGLGEAVGVNMVDSRSIPTLVKHLEACQDGDYFEKGIELALSDGLRVRPVDVSELMCIEIDFIEDLARVNQQLLSTDRA